MEDFPQTVYQAKFFFKNGRVPEQSFVLGCSKDACQERMLTVDQNSAGYLPSSLLSKRIGEYNKNMADLLPFLRDYCNCTEI
jgi:hypothetical protein